MSQGQWVSFGPTHQYRGFLVAPPGDAPLPGVVVYQEAWGVDGHIEEMCHRLAQAGYVAMAPDLFLVDGVRPEALSRERLQQLQEFFNALPPNAMRDPELMNTALNAKPPAERQALSESRNTMMANLNPELHLPKALASAAFLRDEHRRTQHQKVAAIGFCFGGALAALSACHDPALSATVMYYGSPPPVALIPKLSCPIIAFHGERDQRLAEGIPQLRAQMSAAGKRYEAHVYPGAGHAFLNDRRPSYDPLASRHAWARTLAVLDEILS